jgi:hypothetical protein
MGYLVGERLLISLRYFLDHLFHEQQFFYNRMANDTESTAA